LNGEALVAVTGSVIFGVGTGELLPDEGIAAANVHFYVQDAAQFADAVYIDGTLTADAIGADSLELAGDLTVDGNTILGDDAGDSLVVSASARFEAPVDMKDGLVVTGTLFISDDLAPGGLVVEGDVLMEDNVNIEGTLFVTGAVELDSTLLVKEELTVDGTTTLNDAVEVTVGGLFVTGGLYIDGDISEQSDDHAATKGYVDGLIGGGFTIDGDAVGTNTGTTIISGGETLGLTGSVGQVEINIADNSLTFALADNVDVVGDLTVGGADPTSLLSAQSGSFAGDLTVEGNLTVNGTTTTIDSANVLIEDPFILLGKNSTLAHSNGGIIILSGSDDPGNGSGDGFIDLAIGRVANDTWGVKRLDSLNGTVDQIDGTVGELVDFRARSFQVNGDGVTAGGYIEFSEDLMTVATTDEMLIDGNNGLTLQADQPNAIVKLHAPDVTGKIAACAGDSIVFQAHFNDTDNDWLTFDVTTDEILPAADNTISLGSLDNRFKNVYTGDLHLQNDRGSWTLIEEENFISFRNNQTGRRFKMVMEDITDSGTYGPGNDGKL
jgi:cytoskeletal protein CcmA (bactofilin family)